MNWLDKAESAAQSAARAAGQLLLSMRSQFTVREKGPADLVTDADIASQELIRSELQLAFPAIQFVGEEDRPTGRPSLLGAEESHRPTESVAARWLVDPLDGTTNYVHGFDNYSVSIALEYQGDLVLGVIYDPTRDQMYSAKRGTGATCNGKRLQVSRVDRLEEALVAVSFASRVHPSSPEVGRFVRALYRAQAVRRLGSAALNLAYVAAGRFDAYWATSVKVWDVAAGWLLVREAGGLLIGLHGDRLDLERPEFIATSTLELQQELRDVLLSSSNATTG